MKDGLQPASHEPLAAGQLTAALAAVALGAALQAVALRASELFLLHHLGFVFIALGLHALTINRAWSLMSIGVAGAFMGYLIGAALAETFAGHAACVASFAIGLPLLDLGAARLRRRMWPEDFEAKSGSGEHQEVR